MTAMLSATVILGIILVIALVAMAGRASKNDRKSGFWTQYGGAIPADEQARRFDAAEKGVPDMAWAVAYLPPNYCRARPPPVPGEPERA